MKVIIHTIFTYALATVLVLCVVTIVNAQNWPPITKVTPDDREALSSAARAANDEYGWAVDIDGNYAIVGASGDDHDASGLNPMTSTGSAFIYYKTDGKWTQIKKITARIRGNSDSFGLAVAISGDYAIVGAPREDEDGNELNNLTDAGAVYIFRKDEGGPNNWGLVKKVTPNLRGFPDHFGNAVDISGNYIVVGAEQEDDEPFSSGPTAPGAAYIFAKDHGGVDNWGQLKRLAPSGNSDGDFFGSAVALSSGVAVIGVHADDEDAVEANPLSNAGAAYIFQQDQGGTDNWGLVKKITSNIRAANDLFGSSVAVDGDYVLVGTPREDQDAANINPVTDAGALYLFKRNQGGTNTWGQVKKLTATVRIVGAWFGRSVSIDDNYLVGGSSGDGTVIYRKDHGGTDNWGAIKSIAPTIPEVGDTFGFASALSGQNVLVGAYQANKDAFNANPLGNAGAAYFFEANHGGTDNWGQIQKQVITERIPHDEFGTSVSISGLTAVVGAPREDEDASGENTISDAGAAYVYYNEDGNWVQIKKLAAVHRNANDYYGWSVAISNDYIGVGSLNDALDANGNNSITGAGSVYIYGRHAGGINNWGLVKKITADTRMAGAEFGYAVVMTDVSLLVGANSENADAGAAYLFARHQGGTDNWGLLKKLEPGVASSGDRFGGSVAMSGDLVAVSAWGEDEDAAEANTLTDAGSVYLFKQDHGGANNWGLFKKINPSNRHADDRFGTSVSLRDDYLVVGAEGDELNSGAAYVFRKDHEGADAWGQVKRLEAPSRAEDDFFGSSVATFATYVAVGAPQEDENGDESGTLNNAGAVYLFGKDEGGEDTWGLIKKTTPLDRHEGAVFGNSISINGWLVWVGSRSEPTDKNESNPLLGAGAVYAMDVCVSADVPTISATNTTLCLPGGGSATLTITAGELNDSAQWQWHSSSCNGNPEGTGSSITVSPTVTTTYYVRGEVGCPSISGACASITITVSSQPSAPGFDITQPSCTSPTGTIEIQATADSYSFDNGESFQESNTKTDMEPGVYSLVVKTDGCTSPVVDATVNAKLSVPDKPIISASTVGSDIVLTASAAFAYQWYRDGVLIAEATSGSYAVTATGSYTVVVFSEEGCVSVESAPQEVIITGIEDMGGSQIVYPNPASEFITVSFSNQPGLKVITIVDALGRHIETSETYADDIRISVHEYKTGVYLLQVRRGEFMRIITFQKK